MEFKIRKIDDAVDNIEYTFNGEGLFENAGKLAISSVDDSFEYLRKVLSFDITTFFDNRMNTGIDSKVKRIAGKVDKLNSVKFSEIRMTKTLVTPGFEYALYDKVAFLTEHLEELIRTSRTIFDEYQKSLAIFITVKEKREARLFDKRYYEAMEKKQKKEFDKIDKLVAKTERGETTIGKLMGNVASYQKSAKGLSDMFKLGVNEKDFIQDLKDLKNLKARVETVSEIISSEPVTKEAIDSLVAANTVAANQYTLLSKIHYVLFEASQIVINTWPTMSK